jgi:hypothetical protein
VWLCGLVCPSLTSERGGERDVVCKKEGEKKVRERERARKVSVCLCVCVLCVCLLLQYLLLQYLKEGATTLLPLYLVFITAVPIT